MQIFSKYFRCRLLRVVESCKSLEFWTDTPERARHEVENYDTSYVLFVFGLSKHELKHFID